MKNPVKLTQSDSAPKGSIDSWAAIQGAGSLTEACQACGIEPKTVTDVAKIMAQPAAETLPLPLTTRYSWIQSPPQSWRVLWLNGATGIGKTRWALEQFSSPPLIVSTREDLKKFKPGRHGGILFDDMNLRSWEPSEIIHLMDWEMPRSLNVKYGSANIPAATKKIFTYNTSLGEAMPQDIPEEQLAAVLRRVVIWEPEGLLYGNRSNEVPLTTTTTEHTVDTPAEGESSGAADQHSDPGDLATIGRQPEDDEEMVPELWVGTKRKRPNMTMPELTEEPDYELMYRD